MTKEEAILVLDSLSTWLGYERPITEKIVEAIKTLSKPSLPSNLDEAAEEFYPDFSDSIASKAAVDSMRDAFKAGAEWMAGQRMTVKGLLYGGNLGIPDNIPEEFYIDKQEEVIVQIRKK